MKCLTTGWNGLERERAGASAQMERMSVPVSLAVLLVTYLFHPVDNLPV